MNVEAPEIEALLAAAVAGDQAAVGRLLERHRLDLFHMVAVQMKSRPANRSILIPKSVRAPIDPMAAFSRRRAPSTY